MADELDQAEGQDNLGVPGATGPWHPQGLLAGLPAMMAAMGRSTLGALMTPEEIASVDWGDIEPPVLPPTMYSNPVNGQDGGTGADQAPQPPNGADPSGRVNGGGVNGAPGNPGTAGVGPDRRFYSATDGKVIFVGWENPQNHDQGYGYRIKVQGNNGHLYIYGHCDPSSVQVQAGDEVKQGQCLGSYGDPTNGRSTGPHIRAALWPAGDGAFGVTGESISVAVQWAVAAGPGAVSFTGQGTNFATGNIWTPPDDKAPAWSPTGGSGDPWMPVAAGSSNWTIQ
jgi:hypothetical protein